MFALRFAEPLASIKKNKKCVFVCEENFGILPEIQIFMATFVYV